MSQEPKEAPVRYEDAHKVPWTGIQTKEVPPGSILMSTGRDTFKWVQPRQAITGSDVLVLIALAVSLSVLLCAIADYVLARIAP